LLLGLGQLRRIPEGKTAETSTRAARVITGDTYDIRSKDILKKLNWTNLSVKRKENARAYVSKAITGNCPKNIAEKFKISNFILKDMI
jgi:hypothetical protein